MLQGGAAVVATSSAKHERLKRGRKHQTEELEWPKKKKKIRTEGVNFQKMTNIIASTQDAA